MFLRAKERRPVTLNRWIGVWGDNFSWREARDKVKGKILTSVKKNRNLLMDKGVDLEKETSRIEMN